MKNRYLGHMTLALLIFVGISGCSSDHPTLVPASGVVNFGGEPLTSGGSIMFQPQNGRASLAVIQPDGTFVMSTYGKDDGATIGKQMVRVVSRKSAKADESGEGFPGASLIPKKYNNIRKSGITVDIPADGTDSIVINLEKHPE